MRGTQRERKKEETMRVMTCYQQVKRNDIKKLLSDHPPALEETSLLYLEAGADTGSQIIEEDTKRLLVKARAKTR